MPEISLGSGSSPARYGHAGATRHVNCYLEPTGEDSKTGKILVARDGLSSWVTLPDGPVRYAIEVSPYLVVVSGRQVYRLADGGSYTVLGGFPTDGPVSGGKNRRDYPQVGLVADGLFYVVDTQSWTLTHIQDVDLPPASGFAVIDGYGVLPGFGSKWFITGLDDFTTIDGLDFANAESSPDNNVAVAVREGEIVLFGERSTEFWSNTGAADFPFSRSAAKTFGCYAAGSVCVVGETIAFVSHDKTVCMLEGYSPREIGNRAVTAAISSVTDLSTIRSMTWWDDNKHTFYVLDLGSEGGTWAYDIKTGAWHERESYGENHWGIAAVARFGSKLIAGDHQTGALYLMGPDYHDDAGQPLVMTADLPPVLAGSQRMRHHNLYVDAVPGVGLNTTTPANLDPVAMLSWSDNGGKVFGAERHLALGRLGDYTREMWTYRLGQSGPLGRVYRLRISAAVARTIQRVAVNESRRSAT